MNKRIINLSMIFFLLIGLMPNVLNTFANEIETKPIVNYEIKSLDENKNNISFILGENTSFNEEKSSKDYNIKEIKDLDTNTILTSLSYDVDKRDEYHFLINYVNSLDDINESLELTVNGVKEIEEEKVDNKIEEKSTNEVLVEENKANQEISTYSLPDGFDERTSTFTSTAARDNYLDRTFTHWKNGSYEIISKLKTEDSVIIIPNQYQGRQIKIDNGSYLGHGLSVLFSGHEENITKIIFENGGPKVVASEDSSYLFYGLSNLNKIENFNRFDASNIRITRSMFQKCSNLRFLDFSECNFDFSIFYTDLANPKAFDMFADMGRVLIVVPDNVDMTYYWSLMDNTLPLKITFEGKHNYFEFGINDVSETVYKVFYKKSDYQQINNINNLKTYGNNYLGGGWKNRETKELLANETRTPLEIVLTSANRGEVDYTQREILDQYTFTFDPNGGYNRKKTSAGIIIDTSSPAQPEARNVYYKDEIRLNPSNNESFKEGLIMQGWNTNKEEADRGIVEYEFTDKITVLNDMTFYAVWGNTVNLRLQHTDMMGHNYGYVEWVVTNGSPAYTLTVGQIQEMPQMSENEVPSVGNPIRVGDWYWSNGEILTDYYEYNKNNSVWDYGRYIEVGNKVTIDDIDSYRLESDGTINLYSGTTPGWTEVPDNVSLVYQSVDHGTGSPSYTDNVQRISSYDAPLYRFLTEEELNATNGGHGWSKEGKKITKYAIRYQNDKIHPISDPSPIIKYVNVNEEVNLYEFFTLWQSDMVEEGEQGTIHLYPVWEEVEEPGIIIPGIDGEIGTEDDLLVNNGTNGEKPTQKPNGDVVIPDGGIITWPNNNTGTVIVPPSGSVISPDGTITTPGPGENQIKPIPGGGVELPGNDGSLTNGATDNPLVKPEGDGPIEEIGRASCRERVCQYV